MIVDVLFDIRSPKNDPVLIARRQFYPNIISDIERELRGCHPGIQWTFTDLTFLAWSDPDHSTYHQCSWQHKIERIRRIAEYLKSSHGAVIREPENYPSVPKITMEIRDIPEERDRTPELVFLGNSTEAVRAALNSAIQERRDLKSAPNAGLVRVRCLADMSRDRFQQTGTLKQFAATVATRLRGIAELVWYEAPKLRRTFRIDKQNICIWGFCDPQDDDLVTLQEWVRGLESCSMLALTEGFRIDFLGYKGQGYDDAMACLAKIAGHLTDVYGFREDSRIPNDDSNPEPETPGVWELTAAGIQYTGYLSADQRIRVLHIVSDAGAGRDEGYEIDLKDVEIGGRGFRIAASSCGGRELETLFTVLRNNLGGRRDP